MHIISEKELTKVIGGSVRLKRALKLTVPQVNLPLLETKYPGPYRIYI